MTTLAGTGASGNANDATGDTGGNVATFKYPKSVVGDVNYLYVSDQNTIRRIALSNLDADADVHELSQRAAEESLPLQHAFAVIFFVSVGMLFDPHILTRQPLEVLAVMLIM